jgi:hypothetical protein
MTCPSQGRHSSLLTHYTLGRVQKMSSLLAPDALKAVNFIAVSAAWIKEEGIIL